MDFRLIVNADDFGLTAGVNRAILACHLDGAVTSATLMVNMAATEDAAAIARAHSTLGVGLHFNITQGAPVAGASRVASLADDQGQFLARGRLWRRALCGGVRTDHIAAELDAQMARLKALGVRPTHIDSHQHVHALPQVFAAVADFAAAERLPLRITWRWPGRIERKALRRRASEAVLEAMTRRCVARKPSDVRANDGLCSVFDLNVEPGSLTNESYAALLDPYADGLVELMVHPAEVDAELQGKTEITGVSDVETRLLRSTFLADYLRRRGGRLVTYAEAA